jgi:hypothetical protein
MIFPERSNTVTYPQLKKQYAILQVMSFPLGELQ